MAEDERAPVFQERPTARIAPEGWPFIAVALALVRGFAGERDRLSTEFRLAEVRGLAFHEPRPNRADCLLVAEQLAEYRQRQPEGCARTGVRVAEVVQPHPLELRLTTESRPGLVGIDEGLAMMAPWQHIRIVLLTYQTP